MDGNLGSTFDECLGDEIRTCNEQAARSGFEFAHQRLGSHVIHPDRPGEIPGHVELAAGDPHPVDGLARGSLDVDRDVGVVQTPSVDGRISVIRARPVARLTTRSL